MLQLNVAGKIDLWMVFVYYILLIVGVIFVRNVGIEIEDEIKKVKEKIKKKKCQKSDRSTDKSPVNPNPS